MSKKTVKDIDVNGKKVLMRVDFNVPMKDGKITDENRIVAALPTIKYVLQNGGRIIAFSHLGKVKEEADKASKSLKPVADWWQKSYFGNTYATSCTPLIFRFVA